MDASAPDGTIFLTPYASPSVSASHGDKHIIDWLLWCDKEAIEADTELPSGFHQSLQGYRPVLYGGICCSWILV